MTDFGKYLLNVITISFVFSIAYLVFNFQLTCIHETIHQTINGYYGIPSDIVITDFGFSGFCEINDISIEEWSEIRVFHSFNEVVGYYMNVMLCMMLSILFICIIGIYSAVHILKHDRNDKQTA